VKKQGEKVYLLGVDVGTTHIKAVLFDQQGNPVAQSSRAVVDRSPRPGYSEMDPEEIWLRTREVVRECSSRGPSAKYIRALGLSATKGSLLLLDHRDRPLTPLITWRDGRASRLRPPSEMDLYSRTGVPGWGDTLPKLIWFGRHRPGTLRKAAKVMVSPKDYLLYRLLRKFVVDKSLGQTSMLFSLQSLDWDDQLLELAGIRRDQLPLLVDDASLVGCLSKEIASEFNLEEGTAVVAGGDDGCMSQVGLGAIREGRLGGNIGTGAALRAFTTRYVLDPRGMLDCKCLLPYGFVQTGITADAGRLLQWLRDGFCSPLEAPRFFPGLDGLVDQVAPGCEGLLFLPFFTLAGSTVLKGSPPGGIAFGLNYHHRFPHLVRAFMESLGYIFRNIADRMQSLGLPVREVVLGGGGSRFHSWRRMISHILGVPVLKPSVEEASALGAAIMASLGIGLYSGLEEAVAIMVKERREECCYPDPRLHRIYIRAQARFNRAFKLLEPAFESVRRG
jgi:gluconokinase